MRTPPQPTPALPTSPRRSHSLRTLTLLTLGVLAAHGVLLLGMPLMMAPQMGHDRAYDGPAPLTFSTRVLPAPEPQPVATPLVRTPRNAATLAPPSPSRAPTAFPEPMADSLPMEDEVSSEPETDTQAVTTAPPTSAESPQTSPAGPAHEITPFTYPAPVRLRYKVKGEIKGIPYFANGELLWSHNGETFQARLEISHFLLGSRVQTSVGTLSPQGLEPKRFGDKVRSEVAAHFDRIHGKVTFSANTPDAPLRPGAQDQLSVFMQIASLLASAPDRFPPGTTLPFQAVGPRSAESWTFTVGTLENLNLPGGNVSAIRLWRDPTGEYDPKVEIWLAPSMQFMPVRIRLTRGSDDFVEQQWNSTENPH